MDQRRFSECLHEVRLGASGGNLTLSNLVQMVGPKGHAFLSLFLVLPFMQPIPLPGVSTPIGFSIAMIGCFMFLGRPPWLPQRLAKVRLDGKTMLKICEVMESLMSRLERIVKPRGTEFLNHKWVRRSTGLGLLVHAAILSLPLPIPFSNSFPAFVIFLLSLATLEEDIYVYFLAGVAIVVNAAFFSALVVLPFLGWEWVQK